MTFSFVFPGQGSQSVGMMRAYGEQPIIRETFEEASDAVGVDFWQLVDAGAAEDLALTINTQPLMLAAGIAVFRLWLKNDGPLPQVMAGHSLGEYSALVAAGAMDFSAAIQLVRFRAQAMQEAVPAGIGAMAAILGMDAERVVQICQEAAQGLVVAPANLNDPRQIVIAGHKEAVERAAEVCKQKGAKRAVMLSVSAPFHCDLMRPAAERLQDYLQTVTIRSPRIPVINNVDVQQLADPQQIKDALVRQAYSPVRWIETVQAIRRHAIDHIVECGPGKVLSALVKRIDAELGTHAVYDESSFEQALTLVKG